MEAPMERRPWYSNTELYNLPVTTGDKGKPVHDRNFLVQCLYPCPPALTLHRL